VVVAIRTLLAVVAIRTRARYRAASKLALLVVVLPQHHEWRHVPALKLLAHDTVLLVAATTRRARGAFISGIAKAASSPWEDGEIGGATIDFVMARGSRMAGCRVQAGQRDYMIDDMIDDGPAWRTTQG
jgi:hypothetical protein